MLRLNQYQGRSIIGKALNRFEVFRVNIWFIFVLLSLGSCDLLQTDKQWVALHGQTMGTSYTIKARIAPDEFPPPALSEEIKVTLKLANDVLSNWMEHSEISNFNTSSSTGWREISAHLFAVMQAAAQINLQSEGRFDVTLSPLIDLWGFGPVDDGRLPDDAQINEALKRVGQSSLLVLKDDPPRMRKRNGAVSINLSAIAKGYAVDMIALRLEKHGIEDYLVEIGGDLRTHGVNAENQPWRVGIERPDAKGQSLQRIVFVKNMGLATSGDYRKYIKTRGKRLPHIIDPSSGYPVTHDLASVTVLASNTMRADALATALLVMGEKKGLLLAEKLKVAAYFITRKEKGFETSSSRMFEACCADKSSELL